MKNVSLGVTVCQNLVSIDLSIQKENHYFLKLQCCGRLTAGGRNCGVGKVKENGRISKTQKNRVGFCHDARCVGAVISEEIIMIQTRRSCR